MERHDAATDEESQQRWGGLLAEIVKEAYEELTTGTAGARAAGG